MAAAPRLTDVIDDLIADIVKLNDRYDGLKSLIHQIEATVFQLSVRVRRLEA